MIPPPLLAVCVVLGGLVISGLGARGLALGMALGMPELCGGGCGERAARRAAAAAT